MHRFLSRSLPLLMALAGAFACSKSDPVLSVDGYDTSCRTDSDCTVVLTGDLCACAGQPAAINVDGLSRYDRDMANIYQECPNKGNAECAAHPQVSVGCAPSGTCAVCPAGGCVDAGVVEAGAD